MTSSTSRRTCWRIPHPSWNFLDTARRYVPSGETHTRVRPSFARAGHTPRYTSGQLTTMATMIGSGCCGTMGMMKMSTVGGEITVNPRML